MTTKKRSVWWRRGIQILFFVLIALGAVNHTLVERGIEIPLLGSASLHAMCPFGAVVSFWRFVTTGTLVRQIHESSMVLLGLTLVLALLFGPVFCGWVCPFGSFQEWLAGLGRKIFGKRYNTLMPPKLDNWLRWLRYGVLAWTVYMTSITGVLIFKSYDPYHALFAFWTGEVAIGGYIALAITIGLSLIMERPFCKYACPLGALLGLSNLFRIFGIKRQASTCIDCKLCDTACPMNIQVSASARVRNHQCISCAECSSERVCPVEATVVWALPIPDKASDKLAAEAENSSSGKADNQGGIA
jgi:polyferredoxin